MKKSIYTAPTLDITEFSGLDIITLSSSGSGSSSDSSGSSSGGSLEWVDENLEW